jgi:hypothetical protein
MNLVWLGITVVATVAGLLLGAGASWSVLKRQAKARERRFILVAQEHHANSTRSLRANITRLQLELETERASVQRRLAVATTELRTAQKRLEEQLRFAYAELDRLKGQSSPVVVPRAAVSDDGFALTQPFTN